MAGGKETPRQKMIGMMYLVLTALLALNISKDVLDAFKKVDQGLGKTQATLMGKSNQTMADFAAKNSTNPEKVGPFIDRASEIEDRAKELMSYIEEMKARVMAASHKGNKDGKGYEEYMTEEGKAISLFNEEKITKPDENQNNTSLLIGPRPEKPHEKPFSATELRKKLEEYRDFITSIKFRDALGKEWEPSPGFAIGINEVFSFPEEKEDDIMVSWETKNFYHVPMAAIVTLLSKVQVDVENAKADMLSELFAGIEGKSYKFTDLAPIVVPRSNYVLRGDTFQARVFLGAFDRTQEPKIYIDPQTWNGQDSSAFVPAEGAEKVPIGSDGFGALKIAANDVGLGEKQFKGVIYYRNPEGIEEPWPFIIDPFTVAEPALVVSPTKMNVFYRGLPNPVEISVPGVPADKIQPSISGGHSLSRGSDGWVVKPGSGKTATISVSAQMPDGSNSNMGSKEFRVKPIPDPVPKFGGKTPTDNTIRKSDMVISPGVRAEMQNFDFEVKVNVASFKMVFIRDGQVIEKTSNSNRVTAEMEANMKRTSQGQKIYIEDIRVNMPDGTKRKVASITLKVT